MQQPSAYGYRTSSPPTPIRSLPRQVIRCGVGDGGAPTFPPRSAPRIGLGADFGHRHRSGGRHPRVGPGSGLPSGLSYFDGRRLRASFHLVDGLTARRKRCRKPQQPIADRTVGSRDALLLLWCHSIRSDPGLRGRANVPVSKARDLAAGTDVRRSALTPDIALMAERSVLQCLQTRMTM